MQRTSFYSKYEWLWQSSSVIVLLLVFVASCSDTGKPDVETPASDSTKSSDTTLSRDLPTGRFQLPTRITPAPNLWITLPEGYTVKEAGKMPNDEFYILRSDDPSLTDTAALAIGYMWVYVGVTTTPALDRKSGFTRREVVLGNYLTEWKLWTEHLAEGEFYLRQIVSKDYFARLTPELSQVPLNLIITVAGSDSSRVSELMHAAETMSIVP